MLLARRAIHSRVFLLFNILIALWALSACTSVSSGAPIRERQQPPSNRINYHIVAKGETLYAIAWRYGLDYKQLARINGVSRQYLIHPGQRLKLSTKSPLSKASASNTSKSTAKAIPQKSSVTRSPVAVRPQPPVRVPKTQVSRAKPQIKAPSNILLPPKREPVNRSEKKSPTRSVVSTSNTKKSRIYWHWPTTGRVVTNFSGPNGLNKGIDIQGKKGEPVVAAAAGNVVYAGSGLRGYGKLVIIKHNDIFLSAYAHNHRLRVKEGDTVSRGQHIADIGSSGTDRAKLHFEIRRDGKPVNPVRYLPKRKS